MIKNLFSPELWKRAFFRIFSIVVTVSLLWQATDKSIPLMYCFLFPFIFMFYSNWRKESKKMRLFRNSSLENQFYRIESMLSHISLIVLCALILLIIEVHSERRKIALEMVLDIIFLLWIACSIIIINFEVMWYLPKGWKTDTYNLRCDTDNNEGSRDTD